MLSSFSVERKSLPDKLNERRVSLPIELIEEILSWLPVKSAVKFNIVCKLFQTIIQDQKFIEKHMHHAKIDTIETTSDPNAPIKEYCRINGLILERVWSTRRFQIRNYATNKILQLPELEESVFDGSLSHISHTNEYKVLLVYKEQDSGIGMKVLTVGIDIEWRPIEIPISVDCPKNSVISLQTLEGIHYIMELSKPDIKQSKIIVFKPEYETFMEISIPRETLFSSESEFFAAHCEKAIALSCRVDDGLSFWVLDNDKKSKWVEKKLVFKNIQDEDLSILNIAEPDWVIEGRFGCHYIGDQKIKVRFHIESNRIIHKGTSVPSRVENQNTLVSFRGMQ